MVFAILHIMAVMEFQFHNNARKEQVFSFILQIRRPVHMVKNLTEGTSGLDFEPLGFIPHLLLFLLAALVFPKVT